MRAVDTVILGMLDAVGLDVHDGLVEVSNEGKVVDYDLPYVVFHSNIGADDNVRLSGRKTRRSVFFSLMYVGEDRTQAKLAGEKARAALQGRRPEVDGHRMGLIDLEESQRVRRDDDAARPDGSPLFYGVDTYAVSIFTINPAA